MRRTGVAVWHRDKGIYRLEVRICGNDYRGYICFCSGRDAEYTDRTARCGSEVQAVNEVNILFNEGLILNAELKGADHEGGDKLC